jgi:two-component sensor histidine kinase
MGFGIGSKLKKIMLLLSKNEDYLALKLVTSLVGQLDGELEMKRDNRTTFVIRFSVMEKDNQVSAISIIS